MYVKFIYLLFMYYVLLYIYVNQLIVIVTKYFLYHYITNNISLFVKINVLLVTIRLSSLLELQLCH